MSAVIIVNDDNNTGLSIALRLAMLNHPAIIVEPDEPVEFYIDAPTPYAEDIVKPQKSYLNLGKKDRFQR